ncbi:hypothetical protein [Sporomusa sphaeroides]|uniref:Uncharacterized protein n=1 Tax=Sporomusa sphaeroides DSM 2875 TaxID=1337886 RepID=A0A1U7MA12_9FIRM|nr:hypothetical protein [Sporomusa sphaeroides]OLS54364.1 hypothetical protein SPSPH_46100 [Sporomusa sphaeroides DSM 2875]CVK21660.1 hypothetical protein SSPH_04355 [Sporomusa sphaeroides DSM 2875]
MLKTKSIGGILTTDTIINVVALILISSLILAGVLSYHKSMKIAESTYRINTLGTAHTAYYLENNSFATNDQIVSEGFFTDFKMWNGSQFLDSWNNAIVITVANNKMIIELSASSQQKAGKNYQYIIQ